MRPAIRELLLGAYDPDALAWRAIVRAGGGDVSPFMMRLVSNLIRALKAAGVWTLLDRLWLFAAENAQQALIDLVARSTATAVNSPTFTVNRGYAGNGTTAYINSNFNASTAGGHYTQNSASYGVWVETADTTNGHRIAGNDSANTSEIVVGATNFGASVNQAANSGTNTTVGTTGLLIATRTASNAYAFYSGGTQQATAAAASIALVSNNMFFLAGNNAGAAFAPTSAREALGVIAGGWTAAQEAAFFAAVRPYMTSVGVA